MSDYRYVYRAAVKSIQQKFNEEQTFLIIFKLL